MEVSENRDRLIYVLESATRVFKPSQFFAWTQGPLQDVLPHEIMICGMAEGPGQELRMRYFTATHYFKAEHFEAACNPRNGLFAQIVNHWKSTRQPCLFPPPPDAAPCDPEWEALMQRLELRNMAAHGQLTAQGGLNAWFGFFRVADMDFRTGLLLEILLPCITATYARMLSHEAGASMLAVGMNGAITRREVQVLELVRDGCSNLDIAQRLNISAMTAKNHLQNIRKKLNVRTRGQAVAEAMRLTIIQSKQKGI
ncbi:MAG: hypothetical protein B7Y41_15655 [Hydrogenophilales bacterium 28-61-23]|nr:MAG: hypothetical protein B7Y41_15655 [Hydrogenophilales bacterium 28-61-23]